MTYKEKKMMKKKQKTRVKNDYRIQDEHWAAKGYYKNIKQIKGNQQRKNKKKVIMKNEVYTTFLDTCVGHHDDNYKLSMFGLYTNFSWKIFENHVNMVPNAWLTRKGWFFGHLMPIS